MAGGKLFTSAHDSLPLPPERCYETAEKRRWHPSAHPFPPHPAGAPWWGAGPGRATARMRRGRVGGASGREEGEALGPKAPFATEIDRARRPLGRREASGGGGARWWAEQVANEGAAGRGSARGRAGLAVGAVAARSLLSADGWVAVAPGRAAAAPEGCSAGEWRLVGFGQRPSSQGGS